MTEQTPKQPDAESRNGFFVNNGTFSGWFTTADGDAYDIRKLEPREVTDPRTGETSTIWGGYATARDRDLAAKDAMLQAEFKKTGERPAELFAPEARDIPLYITLRNRPGKAYTDIGSFWNARGRFTILARDLAGKSGLRFGGNVLAWKSPDALEADRAAKAEVAAPQPDAAAARDGAAARARKGRDKAPSADA
ncbi:MAG: hypothetical protein C0465_17720 [Ralstonia sp.]|uniref:hypothetical protein n=1 Tax=Ralstonia sp. TaxID=54061 RepID=UPI00257AD428|nr:hypothetical protein [Ralstonia sp.]MBA4232439.1 hypothetical protein [Ralstonia sp.]